ncbi:DNA-binding protein BIN4-like [Hibiscus syriacus]|uniref:DNA-binding protein BIN4-like n=1 Tax=Hibiscus syriacus TaxID=106335 RepID=UPI0019241928|nr:DNA-binding protein BIN4-like [Hibiscus syriacus]
MEKDNDEGSTGLSTDGGKFIAMTNVSPPPAADELISAAQIINLYYLIAGKIQLVRNEQLQGRFSRLASLFSGMCSFQAPTSNVTLSSDSDSLPNGDFVIYNLCMNDTGSEEDGKVSMEEMSKKGLLSHTANNSIRTLSSDSESSPKRKEKGYLSQESGETSDLVLTGRAEKSPRKKTSKGISPKKRVKTGGQTPKREKNVKDDAKVTENYGNVETAEEAALEKHIEPHASTSMLPLVLSEKVQRSKALVECEGDSIDLSGDMGAVGRIVVSGSASENHEVFLDLKGTIYKTKMVPSRTFCIVSFGQTEAKIEAIMNDFIQLKPQSNVYEAETMVEGTLEGFSFDSEDEAEKMPKAIPHQTEEIDGQMNGKSKGRAEKTSMASRKRGKPVGGKSQSAKKARKKTGISKKPKAKK